MRYSFDWDPTKEAANLRKHGVSFRQASSVFRDPQQLSVYDEEHSQQEDRWITLGIDNRGIVQVVIHTFEQLDPSLCQIRIISARKATRAEILQYQETEG
ncbi:MAG: BrnT family toxin [Nodosilinea sp.]